VSTTANTVQNNGNTGKRGNTDKYSELATAIGYYISIFNKKPTWPIAYTEAARKRTIFKWPKACFHGLSIVIWSSPDLSEHFQLSFSSPVKLSKLSLRQCLRRPECHDSTCMAQNVTTVLAHPRMIRHYHRSVSNYSWRRLCVQPVQ